MLIQWYRRGRNAAAYALLFPAGSCMNVATLSDCLTLFDADKRVALLGWRRNVQWQEREWGSEASLQRITLKRKAKVKS